MGAYRELSYENGLTTAWAMARRYAKELPATFDEAKREWEENHGAGHLVRIGDEPGMVLSYDSDSFLVILANGETTKFKDEDVTFVGERVDLSEVVRSYHKRSDAVGELVGEIRARRPVVDHTTGLRFKSIKDWCKDTGISATSASRMLNGQVEEVKGHRLTYADADE